VQTWSAEQREPAIPYAVTIFSILAHFLLVVLMNWSVLNTANHLQADIPMLTPDTSYKREQGEFVNVRHLSGDVCMIIGGFVLCYLPIWITSLCNAFLKSQKLPAVVIQITGCLFFLSSLVVQPSHLFHSKKRLSDPFEKVSRMCLGGLELVEVLTTSSRLQFVVGFSPGSMICTNKCKLWPSNHRSSAPVKDKISTNLPTPRWTILQEHVN